MSKRTRTGGSRTIERRLEEGRGQGRGRDYKPWLLIHDVASIGLASRVKSPLNGRTHHLLSQLETDWLYAFHALTNLLDVREQYPLLGLEETLQIASGLGISHPADPRTGEHCVVTTDFLLTIADGMREINTAVAVKYSTDLASPRTLEKLEIEKLFWKARGTVWRILTEKELPRALVKNMRWLHPYIDLLASSEFTRDEVGRIRMVMEPAVEHGKQSLVEITKQCDHRLGLDPGAALCVARHLIGTGAWLVDLTVELDPRKPIQFVSKGGSNALAGALAA